MWLSGAANGLAAQGPGFTLSAAKQPNSLSFCVLGKNWDTFLLLRLKCLKTTYLEINENQYSITFKKNIFLDMRSRQAAKLRKRRG